MRAVCIYGETYYIIKHKGTRRERQVPKSNMISRKVGFQNDAEALNYVKNHPEIISFNIQSYEGELLGF
jgi:hypothetical protein